MGRGLYPHGRAPAPCGKGGEQLGSSTAPPGKAFVRSGRAGQRLGRGAYPSGKGLSPLGDSFARLFVLLGEAEISALLPLSAYLPNAFFLAASNWIHAVAVPLGIELVARLVVAVLLVILRLLLAPLLGLADVLRLAGATTPIAISYRGMTILVRSLGGETLCRVAIR